MTQTAAPKVHIDFETRSAADLRKVGVHRYAEDPSTEIICLSYRIGDGPVQRWRPGESFPADLVDHVDQGLPVVAHNAGFERAIWNAKVCLGDERGHFSVEPLHPEFQDCTMARALALGLPASLENLGEALDTPVKKDKDGYRLMMQMCRPRTTDPLTWWDDDDRIERLQAYCDQDVLSECAVDLRLPQLSDRERRVWELDQAINDRGVAVDLGTIRRALSAVTEAGMRADREIWRLTNGAVKRCTEVGKIIAWIQSRGIACASVAKGEIDDLVLTGEMFDEPTVVKVVQLRRATARSSTAKYQAMLNTVCRDGRVRGSLAYHKAHTGRWAGSGMQLQNFPRVDDPKAVEEALVLLRSTPSTSDVVDAIELMVGPPMEVLSKCLRSMIVAPAGRKLVGGDSANIEGRLNAWLNDERWKVQAFRDYDAGTGPDLYRVMAADTLGVHIDAVGKVDRQVRGKVPELACGFQGALGAFQKMAYTQDPPVRISDAEAIRIVRAWREKNANIVQGWWTLQDAAIEAVGAPGMVVPVLNGRVQYVVANGFLFCKLPSTRVIAYAQPRLAWSSYEDADGVVHERRGVQYMGIDSFTKKWSVQSLYGGSQMNHVVQGTARDILVEQMFAVEDAGYPIVLTVHDEIISEVDKDYGSAGDYERLMAGLPSWATGLPLSVKAWEDVRWAK